MLESCVLCFIVHTLKPNKRHRKQSKWPVQCTMLANQFAVGLRQEIKIKVAATEGTVEELLAKVKLS